MHTHRSVLRLVLLVSFCAPAAARGQSLVDEKPTLVEQVGDSPRPGESGVSVTFGGELQGGRTDARGWKADAVVAHTTKRHDLLRFDFGSKYGTYRATGSDKYTTVDDNQQASFMFIRPFGGHFAWLAKSQWRRDAVLDLTYRAEGEGGLGVTLVQTKRAYLLAGAAFSVGRKAYGYKPESSAVRDIGLLNVATLALTETMKLSESLDVKQNVSSDGGSTVGFSSSVVARVATHAGLKVYYQYQYDSEHHPAASATQSVFGGGVELTFGAKSSKP